jgi:hypothetical protein
VGGIGGDAVNDAPAPGFLDLGDVGGIDKYFHLMIGIELRG